MKKCNKDVYVCLGKSLKDEDHEIKVKCGEYQEEQQRVYYCMECLWERGGKKVE